MTPAEAARIAATISGWMEDACLQWLFKTARELESGALCVEVGSWLGRSTTAFALGLRAPINMFCVDTWEGTKNEPAACFLTDVPALELFRRNLWRYVGWVPVQVPGDSAESAALFRNGSVAWLYIDADHSYDAVRRDISSWLPKMAGTGIISGHDWTHGPVQSAVRDFFGDRAVAATRDTWIVKSP